MPTTCWLPAGLRLSLVIAYRTRSEVINALSHLHQIKQGKARSIDWQQVRLGLQMINVRVHKAARDSDAETKQLLDTVMSLPPEQICIPRQCWEMAGKTQTICTNSQLPLSQQLEELGAAVWRVTAYDNDDGTVMGNPHVAFIQSVLVTVPCATLEHLVWIDYVGYIAGDQACQEAHSQVGKYIAQIQRNALVHP